MDNILFQKARNAYEQKDFEGALSDYTQCLQESGDFAQGEMGRIYHQIGNCLVKLKEPNDAIQAYTQAAADEGYDAVGTLNYNLGMAYASLRDYENAAKHFGIAIEDPKYDASYKAYSAMGNAFLKLGKTTEAGVAFREAALSEDNPDPTKALLNLGICFMSLGRPADAVASYQSALQFPMAPDFSNKLYANMGQAYVATGQMQDAHKAFEMALADKTYALSDSARADYQRAVACVSKATGDATQAMPALGTGADISGIDVSADGMRYATGSQDAYVQTGAMGAQPSYMTGELQPQGTSSGMGATGEFAMIPYDVDVQEADDRFFNASDEELEQWSKGLVKQDRKRRNVGLKVLITLLVLLLIALGAAAFLYVRGFGFPTQEQAVQQLFANPSASSSALSANVDQETIEDMLAPVVTDDSVTINGVDKGMSESTVYATATTSEGEEVQYKVSLVRDKIGWKVSNIELYFASQQ